MIGWLEKRGDFSVIITFIIAIQIFIVSSLSFSAGKKELAILPILYHLSIFFLLAFFLMITFVKGRHKYLIPVCFAMAVLYGISDEIHQFFVPGRAMDPFDVFIDSVGIFFATLIYTISMEVRK